MIPQRPSQQAFFDVSALLFAVSAALTTVWCASMSFLGMWVVMMIATNLAEAMGEAQDPVALPTGLP